MNGEIDFAEALAARVALLAGTKTEVLAEAAARIRLCPGAHSLVATMRAPGAATALVSGGFTVFADRVAAELGFDRVVANRLEIAEGRLTGRVLPPIVTGETKQQALLALAVELAVTPAATLAVGDGANDLPMLEAAGLGIAFHAKPAVAAAARSRFNHADLTALLYAQGYRKADFVTGANLRPWTPLTLVDAQRDKAQIALPLDQQQDRFAARFLCLVDLGGQIRGVFDLLLRRLHDHIAGVEALVGGRAVLRDVDDDDPLRVVSERILVLQLGRDVGQRHARAS